MDAIQLLLLSVLVFVVGAVAALLSNGSSRTSRYISGIAGMLGSVVGVLAAILAVANKPATLELPIPLPFGHFYLQMDGLSTLMVAMISLLGFAASLYSIKGLEKYDNRNLGAVRVFHQPVHRHDVVGCDGSQRLLLPGLLGDDDPGILFPGHLRKREERGDPRRLSVYAGRACRRRADHVVILHLLRRLGQLRFRRLPPGAAFAGACAASSSCWLSSVSGQKRGWCRCTSGCLEHTLPPQPLPLRSWPA